MKQFCIVALALLALGQLTAGSIWKYDGEKVHRYWVSGTEGTWAAGRAACMETGDLVTIETIEEDAFLEANMESMDGMTDAEEYWLGAHHMEWVRAKDGTEASLEGLSWETDPDPTDNAAVIAMTVDPNDWEFVPQLNSVAHGYLCEAEEADTITGGDDDFSVTIDGVERHFDLFEDTIDQLAAYAACDLAGGYLAAVETDDELTALEASLDGQSADFLWVGLLRAQEWRWTNGELITHERFNPAPVGEGCGYYTQNEAGLNVWSQDADCGDSTTRDAVCEASAAPEDEIVHHVGHYYFLTDTAATWEAARATCQETAEGDLVAIESESEKAWLNANLARLGVDNEDDIWLGIREQVGDGQWRLVADGSEVDTEGDGFTWAEETDEADDDTHIGVMLVRDATVPAEPEWGFVREAPAETHAVLCEGEAALTGADANFEVGTRYFGVYDAPSSWTGARDVCRTNDGWLASVSTDAFLNELEEELETASVIANLWVGVFRNDYYWVNDEAVILEAWAPSFPLGGCGYLRYEEIAMDTEWRSNDDCGNTGPLLALCEVHDHGHGHDDGGLSDGEIAAIAVTCTLVAGGAAAGGGYYAYTKKSSGKVGTDAETGTGENYQAEEGEKPEGDGEEEGEGGEQEQEITPVEA